MRADQQIAHNLKQLPSFTHRGVWGSPPTIQRDLLVVSTTFECMIILSNKGGRAEFSQI